MMQREETGLDQALARSGDGAFAITSEGRVVLWNRAAEKILGYAAREVIGRPCCDIFVGQDTSGNRLCYRGCHVMTLIKMDEPIQSFDMPTRTKARRPIWLNISILVTDNEKGPLTIHLFRDVTATKELLNLVQERLAAHYLASRWQRPLDTGRAMADSVTSGRPDSPQREVDVQQPVRADRHISPARPHPPRQQRRRRQGHCHRTRPHPPVPA